MAVSEAFHVFVLDQLSQIRPIRSRRMFGGVGYYSGKLFFAIAADDTLYFKTDKTTRPMFQELGMRPFRPFGADTRPMPYFEVPAHLFENSEELGAWMQRAIAVAAAARDPSARAAIRSKRRPAGR